MTSASSVTRRSGRGAGFEATHVNHIALSGKPDWALAERITKGEFSNAAGSDQAALRYLTRKDLINTVIEVNFAGKTVRCVEYELPGASR